MVNPGLSHTDVAQNLGWVQGKIVKGVLSLVGRAPEEAGRTLVLAAEGGPETHGQYLDDGKVGRYVISAQITPSRESLLGPQLIASTQTVQVHYEW